jgi:hypothetical protein
MGTILVFRDDGRQPYAEVALAGGDRVALSLDAEGLTIKQIGLGDPKILFKAAPDLASQICSGLIEPQIPSGATPLQVMVAAAMQLSSAGQLEAAFRQATGQRD